MSTLRSSPVRSPESVRRALWAGCLLAIGSALLLPSVAAATTAVAQQTERVAPTGAPIGAEIGQAADDGFDGRSTRDTVRFVVGALVAIAGATTVSLLVFVWHTSPRRRQRVANRRAERHRAELGRDERADEHEDEHQDEDLSGAGEPRD